jgi:CHAD domain-containing protein
MQLKLKDNILKYFQINADIFVSNYSIVRKSADMEALHEMRVSLKRISTLVRMLNYRNKANFRLRVSYRPLRQLFKLVGPLRDFQVQLLLLDELKLNIKIDDEILVKFTAKKNYYEKRFLTKKQLFEILIFKRNFRIIEFYLKHIDAEVIEFQMKEYQNNRKVMLGVYSNKGNVKFNLHSARRMIKDMAYLIEMSNPDIFTENLKYKEYKEIGHYLGNLHDNIVMLGFLKKIMQQDKRKNSENTCNLFNLLIERKKMHTLQYLEKYEILKAD